MQIIEKETITIDNEKYLLLGVDNNNYKYYILDVDTENKFSRIGMVYRIYENKLVYVQKYEFYIKKLNEITHSTLTNEELDILTNTLNTIEDMKRVRKVLLNTIYGMNNVTLNPAKLLEKINIQILEAYLIIRELFYKDIKNMTHEEFLDLINEYTRLDMYFIELLQTLNTKHITNTTGDDFINLLEFLDHEIEVVNKLERDTNSPIRYFYQVNNDRITINETKNHKVCYTCTFIFE